MAAFFQLFCSTDTTDKINPVEVTAHRGYSAAYPENTIPAFKGAIQVGADWAELDVQ